MSLRDRLIFGARVEPTPPKVSWWIGLTREEFSETAQQEKRRMHGSKEAALVSGMQHQLAVERQA